MKLKKREEVKSLNLVRARSASNKLELPQGSIAAIDDIRLMYNGFSGKLIDLLEGDVVEVCYCTLEQFFDEW